MAEAYDRKQRMQQLTDQIVAAYQGTGKESTQEFDRLTDIAMEQMSDEEVQVLTERLLPLMYRDVVAQTLITKLKQYSKSLMN
jgi:hypothetical protein